MKPVLLFEFTKLRGGMEGKTGCGFEEFVDEGDSFADGGLEEVKGS